MKKLVAYLVLAGLMLTAVLPAALAEGGDVNPISAEKITLTYFIPFDSKAAALKEYGEMACYPAIEEATNVHIDFIHPPAGQESEKFNLMVATGDYPDLIWSGWWNYPGGPDKAIDDGIIIDLKPYVEDNAPNMQRIWAENPQIEKDMTTDSGRMYYFTFLRMWDWIRHTEGFMLRGDWLDKLGQEVPETMDDWHQVLTAIKEGDPNGNGKADEIPFAGAGLGAVQRFIPAYGVLNGFYLSPEDQSIQFGPVQPEYKEFVTTMTQWYQEGLIDPDFAATDGKAFNAKVTGNEAGSFGGYLAGNMSTFMGMMQQQPEFRLVGAKWPKADPNGVNYNPSGIAHRATEGAGAAISTANKHVEESVRYLDWHYSTEGHYMINFGPEGVAYDMVDGKPVLKDFILNDPDRSPVQMLAQYGQCPIWYSYIQDPDGFTQILKYPGVREAADTFADSSKALTLPPITYTFEESTEISTMINEINTFVSENTMKWILGTQSIDTFDSYVKQLEGMGLARALEITSSAYDRYQARGEQ